jgi:hypothetical protein
MSSGSLGGGWKSPWLHSSMTSTYKVVFCEKEGKSCSTNVGTCVIIEVKTATSTEAQQRCHMIDSDANLNWFLDWEGETT